MCDCIRSATRKTATISAVLTTVSASQVRKQYKTTAPTVMYIDFAKSLKILSSLSNQQLGVDKLINNYCKTSSLISLLKH
jgi:hypothetical protein